MQDLESVASYIYTHIYRSAIAMITRNLTGKPLDPDTHLPGVNLLNGMNEGL